MTRKRNLVPLTLVPEYRPWANVRVLRRWIYERRIGNYKVGGRVLIDLDELDEFAEAGRREPA